MIILLHRKPFNFSGKLFRFNLPVILILIAFSTTWLPAQTKGELHIAETIYLDSVLGEISGITCYDGRIFAINDSGNGNYLYLLEPGTFKVLSSLKIDNSVNTDWEEITSFNGSLYIGNFGNNFGNRKDLSVYKVAIETLNEADQGVEEITFSYDKQDSFKIKPHNHKWDCEAMVADEKGIWLFSKDWDSRVCRLYMLKDYQHETQVLSEINEYNTGFLVTGSFFDANTDMLYLCGYENNKTYLGVFSNASVPGFSDEFVRYYLPELDKRQVESLFIMDNILYLASEKTNYQQAVYSITLPLKQ